MTTEVAPAAAPEVAVDTTAITPADAAKARSEELIKKHAAAAAVENAGDDEPAEEKPAGEKPRGPDGKFLPEKKAKAVPKKQPDQPPGKPAGSSLAAEESTVPETKKEDKASDQPEMSGGLGKARRLAQEGKVAEALKLIGLDGEKLTSGQWGAWRKENARKERELVAAHAKVQEDREAVKAEARALVAELRPFAEAAEALKAGDEDRVFELIFGKTVDEWQRGRLARMHRGDLSKDPAVAELTRRLDAEKAERIKLEKSLRDREESDKLERAKAEQARQQEAYRTALADRLANSGDERLERAAALPWFVRMVHEERLKSYRYDPTTDTEDCLSEEEAIDLVYDEERLTVAQWKQLTGGSPVGHRGPDTQNLVATDRRATDVKRAARAPTTLSRSEAADAVTHEKPPPGSKELVEYHARLAQRAANQ